MLKIQILTAALLPFLLMLLQIIVTPSFCQFKGHLSVIAFPCLILMASLQSKESYAWPEVR